jgi:DNA damage-binding protein 1
MLNKIKPSTSPTEHLFVGTDRYMYFTLSWDVETKQLRTEKSYMDLADNTAREVQTEQRCLVDPAEEFLTLEVYEGIITTLPLVKRGKKKEVLESGVLGEPVSARIPEFIVRDSAFLPRPTGRNEKPKHALLYEDYEGKVRLRIRELAYQAAGGGEASIEFEDDSQRFPSLSMDLGATILIPVQGAPYGMLILAETQISYFNEENFTIITRPLEEATAFKTWERIDNQRYVLSDIYGKLYLLMLMLDFEDKVQEWKLDVLGEIPVASTLVYLDAGCIFVGSHQGDSKVIRVVEGKAGGAIETVQTFSNIAPILDFTIMDMGNRSGEGQTNEYASGQARLVTGSGAFADGSLRSVRSGVGMQELGIIGEMQNITDVFSLRTENSGDHDDTLLVSFIGESRVFLFQPDGDIEEFASHKSLKLDAQTLLATTLPTGNLLQVTPASVALSALDSGMVTAQWSHQGGAITAVSATDEHVLVSIDGTQLVVLNIANDLAVQSTKQFSAGEQISCVTISSELPGACVVGSWQGAAISVLSLQDLTPLTTTQVSDDPIAIPRNLLVTRLFEESSRPPTLLVATADGNVTTFDLNPTTHQLSAKKSTILGTQEASFRAIPRGNGLHSVFATCEHPSLIYSSEGRIVFSAVQAENAVAVAAFDGAAYPGAVAIATSTDLRVAIIDTERTTHVQTLSVGETVRRIAYSPALRAFGLGTIKLTLRDGVETLTSHFKLADEVLFKELDSYRLHPNEIVETVIRAPLSDGTTGETAERFLVGTSIVDDDETSEHHGRIIVFEVTGDRILKQLAEQSVRGACRRLAVLDNGLIVAALVKTIVVFAFTYRTASTPIFEKRATYRTATAPIDLHVSGSTIAVADLMKSVSILSFVPSSAPPGGQDELVEIARHYQTVWSTAVSAVGEDAWVLADSEENLVVLSRDEEGATEDDRRRLRVTSEIALGEMVNCVRGVEVQSQPGAAVVPKAFLGTVRALLLLFPSFRSV